MQNLEYNEIQQMKKESAYKVKTILDELENNYPGITGGAATARGTGADAVGSGAAVIPSGLAAAGSIIGAGMIAGIGVFTAPLAFGIIGYGIAKGITKGDKNAKLAIALSTAIKKLYEIQEHLMRNAYYFREDIDDIQATIEILKKKLPK